MALNAGPGASRGITIKILRISDNFWNIRGSFKIAGVIDIGTQASLIRRKNGKFIFLDSYTLSGAARREIDELTNDGQDVEAVLNLHPFHTVHVKTMHERYPDARHYGTARHLEKFPELNWQKLRTEDSALHDKFASNFDFSVPQGVDFISANENVHFSSVLAYHRASKTLHVDDTLMYIRLPMLTRIFGLSDTLSFHLTLSKALEKRAGAARDFRAWAVEMASRWQDMENLCAAHTATYLMQDKDDTPLHDRIIRALDKVQGTLDAHERKFG
jgi:hypothetical protein